MSLAVSTSVRSMICSLLLALFITAACITPAAAAPPAVGDAEEQNRRARQDSLERQRRERQADVFMQKGRTDARDTTLPDESPSFPIKRIILTGDSVGRFPWAHALLDGYAGRSVGAAGVGLIVKRLTGAFIDKGYITTRIAVPEQDLSDGVLSLTLLPGRIGAIRPAADGAAVNWRTAFPARPGDILNLRDIEQGLEQLKRVPSQDVDMLIVPGAKAGVSDIVVTVRETKRWRLQLALDDSGAAATGKLQTSASLALDNLFGLNDLFAYTASGDGDRKGPRRGTGGASFSYSVPLGKHTLSFSRYSYRYHQTVGDEPFTFRYSGDIENSEFRLTSLLHRDQSAKTHIDARIVLGRSRSYLEDSEIVVQRQTTTALQLGLTHRRYIGGAILDVAVANRRGVPWFGAQNDPAALTPGSPTTRYSTWLLDTSLTAPVTIGTAKGRYSVALHARHTRDLIFAGEFLSIGNRYTVRGFDGDHTLAAERGWYLRNELSLPTGATEVYFGLDCGAISGPSARDLPGRSLAGAVVGVRGMAHNTAYDLFIGWPLRKPSALKAASPTFGFEIVCQL